MKYVIWDKASPVNGVDAEKFAAMMGYQKDDQVYIIENDDGAAWIVQTFNNSPFAGKTIEEKAQAHLDSLLPEEAEAEDEPLQTE